MKTSWIQQTNIYALLMYWKSSLLSCPDSCLRPRPDFHIGGQEYRYTNLDFEWTGATFCYSTSCCGFWSSWATFSLSWHLMFYILMLLCFISLNVAAAIFFFFPPPINIRWLLALLGTALWCVAQNHTLVWVQLGKAFIIERNCLFWSFCYLL